MLFTLKEVQDYRLQAIDGDIGRIKSFLVDTFAWVVRYIVVEEGSRYVLLSVTTLNPLDSRERFLPVNITKEMIINSPSFDFNQPVSREIERQFCDYFEWPYYWEPDDVPNTLPGDLTSVPLIDMELDREQQEEEEEMIPETGASDLTSHPEQHDHYLAKSQELLGSTIHTTNDDRNAGKLVDMVGQAEDWNIMYLVIDTGGLLSGKKVLVAPSWVKQIDILNSRMDIDLKQETIRNSPEFKSIEDLTPDYQSRLQDYYHR